VPSESEAVKFSKVFRSTARDRRLTVCHGIVRSRERDPLDLHLSPGEPVRVALPGVDEDREGSAEHASTGDPDAGVRCPGRLPGLPEDGWTSAGLGETYSDGDIGAEGLLYLDSSALVKLVVPEAESRALREALRPWPERVSSVVAEIEVEQVARRIGSGAIRRARSVLARLALVELDTEVRGRAAAIWPTELSVIDAIHLATALTLGDDLGALCTYDARLQDAAPTAGVGVVAPV
jgi:predicted nucleic acid-binding protein